MVHNSFLFNFQGIINDIRDKVKGDKEKEKALIPILEAIKNDTEFEDLPLYKEYLSIFDIEHDLGDIELHFPPEMEDSKDDFMTLLQFVAASFSSTYNFEYNEESNSIDLLITVTKCSQKITKKLHELWWIQIARLFEIYLGEMLNLEAIRNHSESEKRSIDEERKMRFMIYQKKIRQLKNKKDIGGISEIDDLLRD